MNTANPRNTITAMTLLEVVVLIVMVVNLAGMILQNMGGSTRHSSRIRCVNNLKQIGLSYAMWANDHNGKFPMEISVTNGGVKELLANGRDPWLVYLVMSNELNDAKVLTCRADIQRAYATNFDTGLKDSISYFVGMDASQDRPGDLLSGDRNITNGTAIRHGILALTANQLFGWTDNIHRQQGNIGLADGSVQELNNSRLYGLIQNSDLATNRLVLP